MNYREIYRDLYGKGYGNSAVQWKYLPWFVSKCKGGKLLDIGCGRGLVSKRIAAATGCSVIGIDIAADITGCGVIGDIRFMPFAGNSFDYCWSCDVLEHLKPNDVIVALTEIRRIMRPGGIAMLSVSTRKAGTLWRGHQIHETVRPRRWWAKNISNTFKIVDTMVAGKNSIGYLVS